MAWTPVVVRDDETGMATVYVRDGEREELIDIVGMADQAGFDWAEERAWMRANEMNEQDL